MTLTGYRKFGGERFFRSYMKITEKMAKSVAKLERKRGCKTRTVQDSEGAYYVYTKCKARKVRKRR